jgi:hypothetical protein
VPAPIKTVSSNFPIATSNAIVQNNDIRVPIVSTGNYLAPAPINQAQNAAVIFPTTLNNNVFNQLVPTATFTLKTVVWDQDETLPDATVMVNGKAYATNENGVFQLPNVPVNATVSISYIGYKTFTGQASQVPPKIVLERDSTALNEVVITRKQKSILGWIAAGLLTVAIIKKATDKSKKVTTKI